MGKRIRECERHSLHAHGLLKSGLAVGLTRREVMGWSLWTVAPGKNFRVPWQRDLGLTGY